MQADSRRVAEEWPLLMVRLLLQLLMQQRLLGEQLQWLFTVQSVRQLLLKGLRTVLPKHWVAPVAVGRRLRRQLKRP